MRFLIQEIKSLSRKALSKHKTKIERQKNASVKPRSLSEKQKNYSEKLRCEFEREIPENLIGRRGTLILYYHHF